jgi:tRNA pseudouridine65 synthase
VNGPATPGQAKSALAIPELALSELYSDANFWVVNKPSGLAVHRGWAPERTTALSLAAQATGKYVYPVHRLDRATSGALVFALDAETTRLTQQALQSTSAIKVYLALVRGITPERGVIDHAIAKSKSHEKRPARTAFERLATFERYSLVRVRTFTGRLHQVRRHLKFISHPLIGDTKYGKGEHNRLFRQRFDLHRLALHAAQLCFIHPVSGERVAIRAPLPSDLTRPFEATQLADAARSAIAAEVWEPVTDSWPRFEDPPQATPLSGSA